MSTYSWRGLPVVALDLAFAEVARREQRHQPRDARLDEVDRSRFERLEEPAREPERDDVLVPRLLAPPGEEAQLVGRGERLALEVGEQHFGRLVVGDVRRAVDVAVAHAVLQRDVPLPARAARGRAGDRLAVRSEPARDRHRAVVGQPLAPVDERHPERLPEQQRAEPRAVDEQLALDPLAVVERERGDEAALGMLLDFGDPPLDAPHPALLGIAPQEPGVEPGVELERIAELGQRRFRLLGRRVQELVRLRRHRRDRVLVERRAVPREPPLEPVMVELDPHHVEPVESERVDVAVPDPRPVDELDAELVGRMRLAHELHLVEPEHRVEQHDLRDRRLAHADGADRLALDQLDRDSRQRADDLAQCRRRHPPRCAAADDDDLVDPSRVHCAATGCGRTSSAAQAPAARRNSSWLGSASAASR
jgi:hypothetical protein